MQRGLARVSEWQYVLIYRKHVVILTGICHICHLDLKKIK